MLKEQSLEVILAGASKGTVVPAYPHIFARSKSDVIWYHYHLWIDGFGIRTHSRDCSQRYGIIESTVRRGVDHRMWDVCHIFSRFGSVHAHANRAEYYADIATDVLLMMNLRFPQNDPISEGWLARLGSSDEWRARRSVCISGLLLPPNGEGGQGVQAAIEVPSGLQSCEEPAQIRYERDRRYPQVYKRDRKNR